MKQYGNDNNNLCFTETDSLLYEVMTNDVYHDMSENKDWYDFSDYPYSHTPYNQDNKKAIGKFKDELNGRIYRSKTKMLQSFVQWKD